VFGRVRHHGKLPGSSAVQARWWASSAG